MSTLGGNMLFLGFILWGILAFLNFVFWSTPFGWFCAVVAVIFLIAGIAGSGN